MTNCLIAGCPRPSRARGYCASHYATERSRGSFQTLSTLEDRFWVKVDKSGDCWVWLGSLTNYGYGTIWINGHRRGAHIVSYELTNGPVPEGKELDHICHDPKFCNLARRCPHRKCVNPAHLEAVPQRINLQRGGGIGAVNAAKTHCVNGHEFIDENTYRDPKGKGRHCLACRHAVDTTKYIPRATELTRPCVTCGAEFSFVRKIGMSPRHCSDICRKVAGRTAARECARRKRAASV